MKDFIRKTENESGTIILTLMLDSITVHQNKELMEAFSEMLGKTGQKIIMDLSNTSYVASMALSSLMFFHKKVRENGGDFVLCGVDNRIKEILVTTKLDKVFNIFDNLEEAMTYFDRGGEVFTKKEVEMKLDAKSFGLAGGILWGASVFVITWMKILGYGSALDVIKSYYIGYSVTPLGSIIGAVYGFFDMGIACILFALLYNKLVKE